MQEKVVIWRTDEERLARVDDYAKRTELNRTDALDHLVDKALRRTRRRASSEALTASGRETK